MSTYRKTQETPLKCKSQIEDSLASSSKRNDTSSRKDNNNMSRNVKNVHSEPIPSAKITPKNSSQNSRSNLAAVFSEREELHGNPIVRSNSTKFKGNLTTSSPLPSIQILTELHNSCSRRNSKESFDEGTTSLSQQFKRNENEINDVSVDATTSKEISRMYDLTNGFQREILSIEKEFNGNTQMKLLQRQGVFATWINELSESNMYLLNLMNKQNKEYDENINQYKQAIEHIVSAIENCKHDSMNLRFDAEGLTDQNKFMQKLIQTLQDNLKHRENELKTLEILKETCDKSKTSLLDVLIKVRDSKPNLSGEEFVPFFQSKSKFIPNDEDALRKELQYLRKEKQEMQSILEIKNGEIQRLNEAVRDQEILKTQTCPRNQEAQTIMSFDKDVKLEGHEDLFAFK